MKKVVIGLHGKTEHGKTTFEKVVEKMYPEANMLDKFAFADCLKEYCASITKLPLDYFYHRKEFTVPDISVTLDHIVDTLYALMLECGFNHVSYENDIKKYEDKEKLKERMDYALTQEFRSFYMDRELFLGHITIGLLLQMIGTDVIRNYIYNDFWVKLVENKIEKSNASLILITDVRFPNERNLILKNNYLLIRIEKEMLATSSRRVNHISETALDDTQMHTLENYGTKDEFDTKVKELCSNPWFVVNKIHSLPFRISRFAVDKIK